MEAIETIAQALANNLTKLLDQYGLRSKIITYIKDEGSYLYFVTIVLKFVVKCEVLGLDESFQSFQSFFNVVNIPNSRTKERRGLITYYKTYGIIVLKKHVNANQYVIAKKFENETNNEITKKIERQLAKKRPNVLASAISFFCCCKRTFQKG